MEPTSVKIFKLNYSGNFEEIFSENILETFSIINVLAIYIPIQKRMYIWIGKNATQGLKKHIASTRAVFTKQFPDLKILRNITIESGAEPSDFFQFIGFKWDDLNNQLKQEEEKIVPIIKEINNLKTKQNDYMDSEEFKEAIEISEKIIDLSEQINDSALKSEQEEFIEQLKIQSEMKVDADKIKEYAISLKEKFDNLIGTNVPENIIQAHEIVDSFKKNYEDKINFSKIAILKKLVSEDERIWNNYLSDQQYSIKELDKLSKQIKKAIETQKITEAENILLSAKEYLLKVVDEDIKIKWNTFEADLIELKLKSETLDKIEQSIEQSKQFKDKFQFREAVSKLESTLEELQESDILEYNKKLKELKDELLEAEQNYVKIEGEISKLENQFKENRKNDYLKAALVNCEKIIENAEKIKKHEIVLTYTQIYEEIENELQKIEKEKFANRNKLKEKIKQLEKVIKFDEDIIPLIEEFSIKDLLKDFSDDVDKQLEQIETLLNEHRVKIKQEIFNQTLLKTSTGDAIELINNNLIQKSKVEDKEMRYNVLSGFTNPWDNIIEEANIRDLIPYNYEIMNIQINGQVPKELPEKILTSDGLELVWEIHDISPKENIEINYDLRPRISRTIIFLLKEQLKIIKTHSNLNLLDLEGFYEVQMSFTNSFKDILKVGIIEDIIPLDYVHFIKEPQNLAPIERSDSNLGDLIKWNLGDIKIETINYQYRLLELYRLEEIKKNISSLSKNGINMINKGDLTEALDIYEKIINELGEFIE